MYKFKKFLRNRLWNNNSSLVQLLGLCPVLAITTNAINSLGLGITTTFILTITNGIVSIFKKIIPKDIRIPIYIIIISSSVTCIEMLLHAYCFYLYQSLGIFIPLIVTNCIIIGRADFIAYNNSFLFSISDGFLIGLGSTFAMFLIGFIREMLGNGTFLFGINKFFNMFHSSYNLILINQNSTIIFAILPAGGFFLLGCIIAFKNYLNGKKLKKKCLQCSFSKHK
ncbi:electron transport complex subunit RsxE [Buchnera aphidicola (Melanaphis sacchari)]|uniref:Ion-translocating oxidoreductase complex subunit E n=1 Tax=Buchnera aphidicola (Melanaphis sacchari) TaxID=2173854 RepID=A0A2U8DG39_9GAMM|nr:electron transport complex subunit RsxE [Buchnera aphidicola]AWH90647.1 electron transport complex subunit RsxE [Buchnera aphidicola (Melanaphis sacchari)]